MARWSIAALLMVMMVGCSGRPELIPNSNKSLRKSSTELAADAARRFPYPADATVGPNAQARAQVGYMLNRLEIVNLSDTEWLDVEIWVNGTHVVNVPSMQAKKLTSIPFQALFDDKGHYFPLDNKKVLVNKVEILRDGQLLPVPVQLAD